jgi:hypothetical protein
MSLIQKFNARTEYVSWTIAEILSTIQTGRIDLNPPYQRAPVWTSKRQAGLIDSIIQGYPIPSLMLVEKYRDNKKVFVCLDGKQRCTAIKAFVDGKVQVRLGDKMLKYCDFSMEDQIVFRNKALPIAKLDNIPPDEECRIFERINRAAPLSAGELVDTYVTSPISQAREHVFNIHSPYRHKLEKYFKKLKDDDKRKNMLVNMTALTCGLSIGEEYLTTSFPTLQKALDEVDEDKWQEYNKNLYINIACLIEMWEMLVDRHKIILPEKWLKCNRIWKLSLLIGYQVYSIHKIGQEDFQGKKLSKGDVFKIWVHFLRVAARDTTVYDKWQSSLRCKNNNLDTRRYRTAWDKLKEYYVKGDITVFDISPNDIESESDDD